jgi:spoIIIJ-associated protein
MSDEPEREASAEPPPEALEALRTGLQAVMGGLDVEGSVEIESGEDGEVVARVVTDEEQPMIGRDSGTINALQYIATQIMHRTGGRERHRVVVDVNDYRARRVRALEALARRAAEEAVSYEEEIELDAMNPAERRIIHMVLKDEAGVVTRSEGEEPRRRVIVEPASQAD